MTLSSETNKIPYDGDDVTVSFPVTFVFWDLDDLTLILTNSNDADTTWTRGTEYEVTGGGGSTGTVTVNTTPTDHTPATGERLTIKSDRADTQDTDLPRGGQFPSAVVEQELDQITRLIQQKQEILDRTMKFGEGEESASIGDLPALASRKSKFLKFDSAGKPTAAAGTTSALSAPDFESSEQTVTALTKLDVAHGLAAIPTLVQVLLRCKTADLGYSAGDEILWGGNISGDHGATIVTDSTNVSLIQGTDIPLLKKALFDTGVITVANWRWVVRAWS